MKKTVLAVLLFVVAVAFAIPAFSQGKKIECVVSKGEALFCDSGKTDFEKKTGSFDVKIGSKIKLDANTEATVKYSDGTTLQLKPGTEIEIKIDGIRMNDGGVWVKLIKSKAGFKVDTPNVTIGARGTIFNVILKSQKTLAKLVEGALDVFEKKTGKKFEMQPGDAYEINENGAYAKIGDNEVKVLFGDSPFDYIKPEDIKNNENGAENGQGKIDKTFPPDYSRINTNSAEVETVAPPEVKTKIETNAGSDKDKTLKDMLGR